MVPLGYGDKNLAQVIIVIFKNPVCMYVCKICLTPVKNESIYKV